MLGRRMQGVSYGGFKAEEEGAGLSVQKCSGLDKDSQDKDPERQEFYKCLSDL